MTKPAPPSARSGEQVVEIDAMDVHEWEHGQRTPQASDANLAALVEQSAKPHESAPVDGSRTRSIATRPRVTGTAPPGASASVARPPASAPAVPALPRRISAPVLNPRAVDLSPRSATATPAPLPPPPVPELSIPRTGPTPRASSSPPVAAVPARAGSSPPFAEAIPSSIEVDVAAEPAAAPAPVVAPPVAISDVPTARLAPSAVRVPLARDELPALSGERPAIAELPAPDVRDDSDERVESIAPRRRWPWLLVAAAGVGIAAGLASLAGPGARAALVEDPAPAPVASPVAPSPPPPGARDTAEGRTVSTQAAADRPTHVAPPATALASPGAALPGKPGPATLRTVQRPTRRPAKRLVVEYSGQAPEVAPGMIARAAEDPAIVQARAAYVAGNQQLFAGDTDAAIRWYRQALTLYPGYVGGYRGLGLAYAQRGDAGKALEAFRTYVRLVPGAKDVPLIEKRIARLSGK